MENNFDRATAALYELFPILSTWKPTQQGLTLELNAYSPSDSEHWHKTCYFGMLEEDKLVDSGLPLNASEIHDPAHGWVQGEQVSLPPPHAITRIYSDLHTMSRTRLPQVEVVTKFLLRRQCRRQWRPTTLQKIWGRLPRLEEIIYEPWQLCEKLTQDVWRDREYQAMVSTRLPVHLKRLSVFEDFNETFLSVFQLPLNQFPVLGPDRVRVTKPQVAAAFAARSLSLEHLSVAFMAEARYFLDSVENSWRWHQLRSLSLTSRMMSSESSALALSRLFQHAGAVALRMPKLEMMNIWNGARGEACAFMYRQMDSSITWKGTWEFKFSHDVLESWNEVVSRFGQDELRVKLQLLDCDILSHGDAIHHLGLAFVIDPVSLWQIRRENGQVN